MSTLAALLFGGLVAFAGVNLAHAQNQAPSVPAVPAADANVYGEFPTEYKIIIGRWLEKMLVDPTSAVIDWTDVPKPGEYKTQKGETFVGYIVDFKVNARNQFGGQTGKQRYRVVVRNGEVVWGGRPRS